MRSISCFPFKTRAASSPYETSTTARAVCSVTSTPTPTLSRTTTRSRGLLIHTRPDGLLLKTTDALGGVTTYAYDAVGNMTQETDPTGRVSAPTYDANGNRVTQTTMRTTSAGPLTIVTQYKYDASN